MNGEATGRFARRGALAAVLAAGAILIPAASAEAAPCDVTDGATLQTALANVTCNPINLAAGAYTSATAFSVTRTVTVNGPDASLVQMTRTGAGDTWAVGNAGNLTLNFVTLTSNTDGAGISLTGTGMATLTNVVISGNTNIAGFGGGIAFSGASLTVNFSVISGNTAPNGGGLEAGGPGTANLNRVLFANNTATNDTGAGGGAYSVESAAATTSFRNVTFNGNKTNGSGGAIRSGSGGATTNLSNVTIAGNIADDDNAGGGDGGGIANPAGGTINVRNSIVANNTDRSGGAPDCSSSVANNVTRQGYELVRDLTGCTFGGGGDTATGFQSGVDPLLGGLASNGGFSQTMALQPGSPAVNTGNPAVPTGLGVTCETTDQRFVSRPQGTTCDLGAYEVRPAVCDSLAASAVAGQATPIGLSCTGDPFIYQLVSAPAFGTLSGFNPTTGAVTYTSSGGLNDQFTYRAVNGPIASNTATVNLTGPPVLIPAPVQTQPQSTTPTTTKKKKCKKKKKAGAAKKCKKK